MSTTIRDLRESKNLSQSAVAEACGLTFSRYERIELGSPRTTEAEIASVLKVLRGLKKSDKKLVGRPFADPAKQAAVEAARAAGTSVSAVLNGEVEVAPEPEAKPARKPRARKPKAEAADDLI